MYPYACNEHLNVIWNIKIDQGKTQNECGVVASSVQEGNFEFDPVISYYNYSNWLIIDTIIW